MSEDLQQPERREMDPLDPGTQPPLDRYCDVVLDGGVINGVVYPGMLIELARKFRFRSLGGTSVGAIAAALAAACEYRRRFGSDNGFNEGLAKMPGELADWIDEPNQITRIRSLFQPHASVQPLFDWFVDLLGASVKRANTNADREQARRAANLGIAAATEMPLSICRVLRLTWLKAMQHLMPKWFCVAIGVAVSVFFAIVVVLLCNSSNLFWHVTLTYLAALICLLATAPLYSLFSQVCKLIRLTGSGMCTGMRAEGSLNPGLSEWLHEGVQNSANLPFHKPLTFGNLWDAPGGPKDAQGSREPQSIDLRMITTCLSHGRIYELPLADEGSLVMFRLSEFKPYFPVDVVNHLRRVSKRMSFEDCALLQRRYKERMAAIDPSAMLGQLCLGKLRLLPFRLNAEFDKAEDATNGLNDPDIRELPSADLPIVVAARLSMSCPVLFQNMRLIGFNLDKHIEDVNFVRLWFSDGGIGSNFPIHLFDKAIPRWPSFGLKILEDPPRLNSSAKPIKSYIPFAHKDGADDNLVYPRDVSAFTAPDVKDVSVSSFVKLLFSIYTSAKDGHDQSYLRMPDVRNRVVRIYLNNRAGNMLNLKIEPVRIIDLALVVGAEGGRNAALAYLADVKIPGYGDWANSWQDHRWVRFNMLTRGLRSYLKGFTHAVHLAGIPDSMNCNTLIEQIKQSVQTPPLQSMAKPSDEITLTQAQSDQLLKIVEAISALEAELQALDSPLPYSPQPLPVLRFMPKY